MELKLKNPIVFFDLETTGVDVVKDRIVEISIVKVNPDGSKDVKTRRINPTIPIPEESSKVHGIYDEDIKDEPTFKTIARSLAEFIKGCDFAGYNSNRFDIPLLVEEFLRAGVDIDIKKHKCVDVQTIFHKKEQRTLSAAYMFYCDKTLENAHSAEADTLATYEILKSQLDKYNDLENDIDFLAEFSTLNNFVDYAGRIIYNEEGEEVFNFGKHKDKKVADVFAKDPSYFSWIMNGDFPQYTKKILTEIRLKNK